jgi:hypothetical protein
MTLGSASENPIATVVLPAYNEASALPLVLTDLNRHLDDRFEILVVDDGSTDDSAAIATGFRCRVVRHADNRGKGAAMVTGATEAKSDRLVFIDADGTYPVAEIEKLVELLDDHDLVRAERPLNPDTMPAINRWGNRLFNRLIVAFHRLEGTDFLSGLYGIRRDEFLAMGVESAGFDIEVEIGIKARLRGLKVATFPIEYHPRIGEKKLRPLRDGIQILARVAGMLLLYRPVATFVVPGLIVMALALAGVVILAGGPVQIASVGLSINTFILAVLGILAGLQLVIFGVAATLYRVEAGYQPRRWLLGLSSRVVRLGSAALGLSVALAGAWWTASIGLGWLRQGGGPFLDTDRLVAAAAATVFGLQLLSAGLFLSIFAGRLPRYG